MLSGSEASLQLDTEVAMTQYIEKLIDRYFHEDDAQQYDAARKK